MNFIAREYILVLIDSIKSTANIQEWEQLMALSIEQ